MSRRAALPAAALVVVALVVGLVLANRGGATAPSSPASATGDLAAAGTSVIVHPAIAVPAGAPATAADPTPLAQLGSTGSLTPGLVTATGAQRGTRGGPSVAAVPFVAPLGPIPLPGLGSGSSALAALTTLLNSVISMSELQAAQLEKLLAQAGLVLPQNLPIP